MKKTITRRSFNGLALWSIPSASVLLAQEKKTPEQRIEQYTQLRDVKIPDALKADVRKALLKTERKIATLRAFQLKRDTQPALILGVFDAPEMFALEGNPDAG